MSTVHQRRSLFFEFRALLGIVVLAILATVHGLVSPDLWLLGIAFLLSDFLVRFLPLAWFQNPMAGYAVFILDVGILTVVLHSVNGKESETLLLYYLTVFIATVGESVRKSVGTAVVVGALYLGLRSNQPGNVLADPEILIRIPLFFVTAMTCGYLAQELRQQETQVRTLNNIQNALRAEIDRFAKDLARSEDLRAISLALMERFRNLVHDLDAVVWEADGLTLRFTFVSERAYDILGHKVDQWLSEPDFWADHIYHEDREQAVDARRQAIYAGRNHKVEYRMNAADGRVVWVRDIVCVNRNAEGQVLNLRGIMLDITEQKQLEEQFRQAQKMEAVGRLAGGVAHDFNNLLTVITGYSQLLHECLQSNEPLRKYGEEIMRACERATALTRRLLGFSRRQAVSPQVLNLNTVLANLEKMLSRMIGEDVELVTLAGRAFGQVKADPHQIELAIMNLAVNARDAMPRGGRLIIETKNVYLDETYTHSHVAVTPGPYVMLAVSDTGTGMDAETVSHIFEPFFTTKERGKGTGLGLATVYGIVKQSNGFIWVYSEPGVGTTFKIYLPRVDEIVEKPQLVNIPVDLPQGSETILLVEDDDSVRLLVRGILQSAGYTVLEAGGPTDALATCQQYKGPIHLLFTDVVMPQMNGRDLAGRLEFLRPETKVLYMSGYTSDAIVHYGVLERGVPFVEKPFSSDTLARKVREVLDSLPNPVV